MVCRLQRRWRLPSGLDPPQQVIRGQEQHRSRKRSPALLRPAASPVTTAAGDEEEEETCPRSTREWTDSGVGQEKVEGEEGGTSQGRKKEIES
jgi:hypothetical protein